MMGDAAEYLEDMERRGYRVGPGPEPKPTKSKPVTRAQLLSAVRAWQRRGQKVLKIAEDWKKQGGDGLGNICPLDQSGDHSSTAHELNGGGWCWECPACGQEFEE